MSEALPEIKSDASPSSEEILFLQLAHVLFGQASSKAVDSARIMGIGDKGISLTLNAAVQVSLTFGCHFLQEAIPDFDQRYDRVAELIKLVIDGSREQVREEGLQVMEIGKEAMRESESCSDSTSEPETTS